MTMDPSKGKDSRFVEGEDDIPFEKDEDISPNKREPV